MEVATVSEKLSRYALLWDRPNRPISHRRGCHALALLAHTPISSANSGGGSSDFHFAQLAQAQTGHLVLDLWDPQGVSAQMEVDRGGGQQHCSVV